MGEKKYFNRLDYIYKLLVIIAITITGTVLASDICRKKNALAVTAWSLILGVLVMVPMAAGSLRTFDFSGISPAGWFGLVVWS